MTWSLLLLLWTVQPGGEPLRAAATAAGLVPRPSAGTAAARVPARRSDRGGRLLRVGLAHMAARRYGQALHAFEAASRSSSVESRELATYNLGIALLRLSRFQEAEDVLLRAAVAPRRRGDALLAAALAAAHRRDLDRAVLLLDRAEVADPAGALADSIKEARRVVGDRALEDAADHLAHDRWERARAGYRLACALAARRGAPARERAAIESALGYLDVRLADYRDARTRFAVARSLQPENAETHLMLGRLALERGDTEEAVRGFTAAASSRADPETRQAARRRLDALSAGLRSQGAGFDAEIEVLGGYDTDASQSAFLADRVSRLAAGGGFASLAATASYGGELGSHVFAQLHYDLDQIAYAQRELDPLAVQAHTLGMSGEATSGSWRVLLPLDVAMVFSGVRSLAPFETAFSARPSVARDEGRRSATAIDVEWVGKRAASPALAPFGGHRLGLGVKQTVRLTADGGGMISLRAFLRREALGREIVTTSDDPGCAQACFQVPLGHRDAGLLLGGSWRWPSGARLEVGAALEWLRYDGEAPLGHLTGEQFAPDVFPGRRRSDLRLSPAGLVEGPLGDHLRLVVRYELVVNRSNIDDTVAGHDLDFDNKSFIKHTLALGVAARW